MPHPGSCKTSATVRELPIHNTTPTSLLRLRGHTLLCLQGFRGLGYSPGFVENLSAVHRGLAANPEILVEVVDAPDVVCGACPHEAGLGCTLNGDGTEAGMKAQDQAVLGLLGLRPGDRLRWAEVQQRIGRFIQGSDLPTICGQCRWLSLNYCRDGIDRLRAGA
jgi:hypothetical protein